MNPVSSSVGAPALPQVSLIPPEFAQRRQQTRMRILALIVLLVGVGIAVAGWVLAVGIRAVSEASLSAAEDERLRLNTELSSYDYVRIAQAAHNRALLADAMAGSTDVKWDDYLTSIGAATPDGLGLTQVSAVQTTPAVGLVAMSGSPFAQPDLGELSFTGQTTDPNLVNTFVVNLAAISGIYDVQVVDVRIESLAETTQPIWAFEVSGRLGFESLSNRLIFSDEETGADE